uniref:type IV secretory system conjugative DNA transfer family protein n=1 Tax=Pleomorphomonas koreensis TaxID=257440 RepID=UPI00055C5297
ADIRKQDFLKGTEAFDAPSSILLGTFIDPATGVLEGQIHWDREGHLLTVAPTRSGKSTTVIVPNLLRYQGSCVVLDPKGELYRDTSAWRARDGREVYRIAPFEETTHGFNPLSAVRSLSDARALADLMIPHDPHAQEFFKKDAVAFLSALILFLTKKAPADRRTLAEVRRLTALPTDEFLTLVKHMSTCGIPAVVNETNIILGKNKDRAIPSLRDTLNTEMAVWDDEGVIAASSRNDVDFRALKDRPITVYVTVPFDKMEAFAPFLKIVLSSALEAMIRNTRIPDIPVLFVLDEFLSLGPFPQFRNAIRTHAGAGVRLWFFLQDVSTLEEHYPSSWKTFFNSAVKLFFGTDETFTGKLVSDLLGDTTVGYQAGNLSGNRSTSSNDGITPTVNNGSSVSESVSFVGRPLLTPTEVVAALNRTHGDKSRDGFLFLGGTPPVRTRLVPWFLGSTCKARIGQTKKP